MSEREDEPYMTEADAGIVTLTDEDIPRTEADVKRRVAAALAPVQALAEKWRADVVRLEAEPRHPLADEAADVTRAYLEPLDAALASAGATPAEQRFRFEVVTMADGGPAVIVHDAEAVPPAAARLMALDPVRDVAARGAEGLDLATSPVEYRSLVHDLFVAIGAAERALAALAPEGGERRD